MSRGIFVVFEGGDSVGKSTQLRYLIEWLADQGVDYLETRQPGGTSLGQHIRRLLLDGGYGEVSPWAETLLYAADKAQHVDEVIQPALNSGRVVVCDRFVDSTLAYQGAGRRIEPTKVAQVANWATNGLRPDLTVLLDADPAIALAKITRKDRLEAAGLEFHRDVRQHFLALAQAEPNRYLIVKALGDRQATAAIIRQRVAKLLNLSA